jgi:uncharacterized protein
MNLSRRKFLESTALTSLATPVLLGASVDPKTGMPTRILGRTGARVSIVAFGCGSRWLSYKDPEIAIPVMNRAIDQGITYLDTAFSYGNGRSEEWAGQVMKTRRKEVWLATKVSDRKGDDAMRTIEGSLKRLNTDQIDLLHIHSLTTDEDLAAAEAQDGVLKVLYKLRDQKVVRAIGVTSHTDPVVLRKALERHDFDCTQMALNAARAGMRNAPGGMDTNLMHDSFETIALPVANRKKMGVIAMKVFGQEKLVGKASIEQLMRYALSLPVTAAVLGMPKPEFLEQNLTVAKGFKPMPRQEMRRLSGDLSTEHKAYLDSFFRTHVDA